MTEIWRNFWEKGFVLFAMADKSSIKSSKISFFNLNKKSIALSVTFLDYTIRAKCSLKKLEIKSLKSFPYC